VGDWLRSIGIEPRFMSWEERYGNQDKPA